jgi:hypothetical protein
MKYQGTYRADLHHSLLTTSTLFIRVAARFLERKSSNEKRRNYSETV